jgi:transcriptional regulator with XRE-family HTH domain
MARTQIALGLRNARNQVGLSQTALAERIGLTQARVSELETLHGNPCLSTLVRVLSDVGLELFVRKTANETVVNLGYSPYEHFSRDAQNRSGGGLTARADIAEIKNSHRTAEPVPSSRKRSARGE